MALASRQVIKELNRITEEKLKSGFIPTVELVRSELIKFYKKVTVGTPSFKARQQKYRKVWNVDIYNDNLEEIYDDLNSLYDEIVSQFTTILINFDFNDTERTRILHEVNTLNSEIDDLLLLAADVEGYVYSVHDSFLDRNKINLTYSNCEINTDAGIVMLRESRNGIKKIDLSHYYNLDQFLILAEKEYAKRIVSNKLLAGSKFGYAFSDLNAAWNQRIVTTEGGKLQVSFIISLNPSIDNEIPTSRIEILGHSPRPLKVEPLWSVDNINFKALPVGDSFRQKEITDNKVQVWNFPETNIQYIKFLVTFDEEDEDTGGSDVPQYLYNMGFKNISLYQAAYTPESYLYSKIFEIEDPTGEALTVDKVSLVTEEEIPEGSNLEHFVSLGDLSSSDPTSYNWIAISPVNDSNPAEPQLIDFRHIAFLNTLPLLQWDESSYDTPLASKNGIYFYKIYEFPYEPIRDSVTIYRGDDNWQVIPKYDIERKAVYDESHTLPTGNGGTESSTLAYPSGVVVEGDGLIRGSVKVKSSPGVDPDVTYTTPNDYLVDYVTKDITRPKDSTIRSDGATIYVDYQYDLEVVEPTVYRTYSYILNPDGIDINVAPFSSAEIEGGQFLKITTNGEEIDISFESSYHLPPGWHKIETTAQPQSSDDRFYDVNGKYLYEMSHKLYAYGETLQEVSYFELTNTIKKNDRTKYAVYDYDGDGNKEIIVNYRPQTEKYTSSSQTYGHNYDMLNPEDDAETYELTYKYISTTSNTLYYSARFTRDLNTPSDVTPTLKEYTLRVGY